MPSDRDAYFDIEILKRVLLRPVARVIDICHMYSQGSSAKEIADIMGMSEKAVYRVVDVLRKKSPANSSLRDSPKTGNFDVIHKTAMLGSDSGRPGYRTTLVVQNARFPLQEKTRFRGCAAANPGPPRDSMRRCACGNEAVDLHKIALCSPCLESIRKLEDSPRLTPPLEGLSDRDGQRKVHIVFSEFDRELRQRDPELAGKIRRALAGGESLTAQEEAAGFNALILAMTRTWGGLPGIPA